jgi:hypothetical protein
MPVFLRQTVLVLERRNRDMRAALRGAHRHQEYLDLDLEVIALARQRLRRGE